MTASAVRTTSYFANSRAPRYSVLFALPLLIVYEGLAALLGGHDGGTLRNGADVLMRSLFTLVAGRNGSLLFIAVVILVGVWLVARDLKRSRVSLRPSIFFAMLVESTVLAVAFGIVVSALTAQVLGSMHLLAMGQVEKANWAMRLMLSLGAGLYEELFFRVLLVSTLAAGARVLLRGNGRAAGGLAVVVSAVVFSAFHYIGPYGDPFQVRSFAFRTISGVAFSALYLVRGFGITAWTHALYDAFLLLF
jgi:Type II CAAX prenyl endopeptidase Rce1-like